MPYFFKYRVSKMAINKELESLENLSSIIEKNPPISISFSSFFYSSVFAYLVGDIKTECCGRKATYKGIPFNLYTSPSITVDSFYLLSWKP